MNYGEAIPPPLGKDVELRLPASLVSHSEFITSQVMPYNMELQVIYTQKIIPEQTNYMQMNDLSVLIDN